MTTALTLTHVVAAEPSDVFDLWSSATGLDQWWWTHWANVRRSADPRLGGSYLLEAPDQGIAVRGEFTTFDRPSRLAFTWIWADADGDGPDESVEVRLTPIGIDGSVSTQIDLTHIGPWTTAEQPDNYRQGWEFVLKTLSEAAANRTT